jgi:hyperosmotically inducible periplasmic protein
MSFRIGALLCLSGLAACSNTTTEPAQGPDTYDTTASTTANDGSMTPASLEDSTVATPTAGAADRPGDSSADARAPLVGGANTNDMRTNEPAPATDASKTAAPGAAVGTQPDNTKVNKRDTNSAALTPLDQGNNETDLKITQQIRQAVMDNGSLSFTAKNVKIITNGGKVTLRGPVKTEQERSAIDAAARKVAGAQVDNQIEVKK